MHASEVDLECTRATTRAWVAEIVAQNAAVEHSVQAAGAQAGGGKVFDRRGNGLLVVKQL